MHTAQYTKGASACHAPIQEAETNLAAAKELLISIVGDDGSIITPKKATNEEVGGKVIEGDILKLTIADDGSFIYKQIGPIERVQMMRAGEYGLAAGSVLNETAYFTRLT